MQIQNALITGSFSYNGADLSNITSSNAYSASLSIRTTNLESTASSLVGASSSFSDRTTQVEKTYASTGSNTFTGVQNFSNTCNPIGFNSVASVYTAGGLQVTYDSYFSSSVFVNGNLTVFGTQSVVHVSSSQFNIGTNIITVNTSTPSIRYGGLSVYDSGSTGLSGSIFWDSEANHWIYANASGSGGGATYGGGMFISGPRSSGLGCEQGTTSCMLLAGQGGDHLTSSLIYHDSARTCIPNILNLGGVLNGTSANFTSTICMKNNLVVVDGSNSLYAWTACSTFQPGLYAQLCIGSAAAGLYSKMYGAGVNAGLFGLSTECMGFVGTDGACGKGLLIGTANNAPIYFGTNNIESFRITTNQYLLLGSTQNAYKLEVTAPTNTNASYFRSGGTSGYAAVAFSGDGSTVGVLSSTGCHVYLGTANGELGNQFGTNGELMIQKGYTTNILKLSCTGRSYFTGNLGVVGVTNPTINLNVGHPDHGIGISYMGSSALPSLAGLYTDTNASGGGTGYGDLIVKARTDYGGFYGVNFFTSAANNTPLLRMRVNSAGQIVMPYQPAFMAYGNGNATVDASGTYMIFPSVQMNRGGHYNVSNGIFTVPIAGVYYFSWSALGNSTNDIYRWFIRVNDTTFLGDYHLRQDTTETGSAYPINANRDVIMNLSTGDTVRIWFRSDNGSPPYGVNDAASAYLNFMGYLIG
jgi:hypothetical protein